VRYHGVYSINRKHVRYSIRKAFAKTTSPCQLCSAPASLLHCYDCIGPSDSGINMCVGCLMHFHTTTEVGAGHRILPEGAPPDFVLSYRDWRQRAQVRMESGMSCLSLPFFQHCVLQKTVASSGTTEQWLQSTRQNHGAPNEIHTIVCEHLNIDDLDRLASVSRFHRHICLHVLRELIKKLWSEISVLESSDVGDEKAETEVYTVGQTVVQQALHSREYAVLRKQLGHWAYLIFKYQRPYGLPMRFRDTNERRLTLLLGPYALHPDEDYDYCKTYQIHALVNVASDRALRSLVKKTPHTFTLGHHLLRAWLERGEGSTVLEKLIGKGAYTESFTAPNLPTLGSVSMAEWLLNAGLRVPVGERLAAPCGESVDVLLVYAHHCEDLVSIRGPGGETLLHMAVRRKSISLVKYLLERGLSKSATNDAGQTPKDIAIGKRLIALLE
jgi:ankyrin repeat protein